MSFSMTQHTDFDCGESQTSNPLIPSLILYQLSHRALTGDNGHLFLCRVDPDQLGSNILIHPVFATRYILVQYEILEYQQLLAFNIYEQDKFRAQLS